MKSFDITNVRLIRAAIDAALQEISKEFKVKITLQGNSSYTDKIIYMPKAIIGIEEESVASEVPLIDLVGTSWRSGAKTFTITGVSGTQLIGQTNRGKKYLIKHEQLNSMIRL